MTKQIDQIKTSASAKSLEVLEEINWDSTSPIDPFAIAKSKNIEVIFSAMPQELSGFIQKDTNGKVKIHISAIDPVTRKKFTCAHELGHFYQEQYNATRKRSPSKDPSYMFVESKGQKQDYSEIYADEFAGNLLMPTSLIKSILNADPAISIKELATKLEMSVQSTSIRLQNLGYIS